MWSWMAGPNKSTKTLPSTTKSLASCTKSTSPRRKWHPNSSCCFSWVAVRLWCTWPTPCLNRLCPAWTTLCGKIRNWCSSLHKRLSTRWAKRARTLAISWAISCRHPIRVRPRRRWGRSCRNAVNGPARRSHSHSRSQDRTWPVLGKMVST